MRQVSEIIIHCSASPDGRPHTVEDIDRWHRERGFKRTQAARTLHRPHLTSVGYHFVLYTDGTIAPGRHVNEVGAHAEGRNKASVGVCMIGTSRFTLKQWEALQIVLQTLKVMYPKAKVIGHRDCSQKECPGFSVADYLRDGPPHDKVIA